MNVDRVRPSRFRQTELRVTECSFAGVQTSSMDKEYAKFSATIENPARQPVEYGMYVDGELTSSFASEGEYPAGKTTNTFSFRGFDLNNLDHGSYTLAFEVAFRGSLPETTARDCGSVEVTSSGPHVDPFPETGSGVGSGFFSSPFVVLLVLAAVALALS